MERPFGALYCFANKMPKTKRKALYVHYKQLPFMQRIADHARAGYCFYVTGDCPVERGKELHYKFQRLYEILLDKDTRYRNRREKKAVFLFLAYQPANDPGAPITWVLLRTDGTMPVTADPMEKWRSINGSQAERLRLWDRYELRRHTRPKFSRPSWSWCIGRERYEGWHESIVQMIRRHQDRELERLLSDIKTAPGFALIREQLKNLFILVMTEWQRRRKDPLPDLPRFVGYARRVKSLMRPIK